MYSSNRYSILFDSSPHSFGSTLSKPPPRFAHPSSSREVRRVEVVLEPDEVFLDAARGDKAVEDRDATSLVVCSACPRTTERLLADDRARALFVVVDVARRVPQPVRRLQEHLAVRGEAA